METLKEPLWRISFFYQKQTIPQKSCTSKPFLPTACDLTMYIETILDCSRRLGSESQTYLSAKTLSNKFIMKSWNLKLIRYYGQKMPTCLHIYLCFNLSLTCRSVLHFLRWAEHIRFGLCIFSALLSFLSKFCLYFAFLPGLCNFRPRLIFSCCPKLCIVYLKSLFFVCY